MEMDRNFCRRTLLHSSWRCRWSTAEARRPATTSRPTSAVSRRKLGNAKPIVIVDRRLARTASFDAATMFMNGAMKLLLGWRAGCYWWPTGARWARARPPFVSAVLARAGHRRAFAAAVKYCRRLVRRPRYFGESCWAEKNKLIAPAYGHSRPTKTARSLRYFTTNCRRVPVFGSVSNVKVGFPSTKMYLHFSASR